MTTDASGTSYENGTNISEGVFAMVSLFLSLLYAGFGWFLLSQSGISLTCIVKNNHPDGHYVAMDARSPTHNPDVLARGNSFNNSAVQGSGVLLDGPVLPSVFQRTPSNAGAPPPSRDATPTRDACEEGGEPGVGNPEDPPSLVRTKSKTRVSSVVMNLLPVRRSVSFALPQGVQA